MGIQPDASLTKIGFAAPAATIFGIILNVIYYLWLNRAAQRRDAAPPGAVQPGSPKKGIEIEMIRHPAIFFFDE